MFASAISNSNFASVNFASVRITTASTLIMTVLLLIGLFFFIRASGKDRTEIRRYVCDRPVEELGQTLQIHLLQRTYQLIDTDDSGLATFIGQAQPSGFLTGLLSLLAGVGLACLALVMQVLKPELGALPYGLLLCAPLAGWYYRQKSTREECLKIRIGETDRDRQSRIDIQGHRDELNLLSDFLQLEEIEA